MDIPTFSGISVVTILIEPRDGIVRVIFRRRNLHDRREPSGSDVFEVSTLPHQMKAGLRHESL